MQLILPSRIRQVWQILPDLCKYLLVLFYLKQCFIHQYLPQMCLKRSHLMQKLNLLLRPCSSLDTTVVGVGDVELCHNVKIKLQQLFFPLNKSKGELKKKQQLFWLCSGAVQRGLVLVHFGQRDMPLSLSLSPPLSLFLSSLIHPHSLSLPPASIQQFIASLRKPDM